MHTDLDSHVKNAEEIASALGQLFFMGRPAQVDGVRMMFVGLRPYEAAATLTPISKGRIYILPAFKIVDDEVRLDGVLILDGMSQSGQTTILGCDPVCFPGNKFGLLSRCKDEVLSYFCQSETQIMVCEMQRPQRADKMIKAGMRALAARMAVATPIAA